MRLILFDVDGTLIDSQAIIHESMRLTFLRWGLAEPDISATRAIVGLTLESAIATMLGRAEVDYETAEMAADYREIYVELAGRPEMQSLPFLGIEGLVERLACEKHIKLGLVTGKSRRGVARLLQTPIFRDRFVVARCADDCPSKPHPAMVLECCDEAEIPPHRTMVIGDTSFDMEMARAARATAIGVNWGYHPVSRIEAAGAAYVAASCKALEAAIHGWLGGGGIGQAAASRSSGLMSQTFQYA
ncbi:MAG: HAD-IA family hydrolase [Nitratireductor sp.]|nr:HAD-IA family hydrolase [Nitratireductor sp.]